MSYFFLWSYSQKQETSYIPHKYEINVKTKTKVPTYRKLAESLLKLTFNGAYLKQLLTFSKNYVTFFNILYGEIWKLVMLKHIVGQTHVST